MNLLENEEVASNKINYDYYYNYDSYFSSYMCWISYNAKQHTNKYA